MKLHTRGGWPKRDRNSLLPITKNLGCVIKKEVSSIGKMLNDVA